MSRLVDRSPDSAELALCAPAPVACGSCTLHLFILAFLLQTPSMLLFRVRNDVAPLIFPTRSNFKFLPRGVKKQYTTAASTEPLRVLFCGSDAFSIASLRAVHDEKLNRPDLIASLDVVHRPGKRTGRGLKVVREVPIKAAAEELGLPRHEIDTFTGWSPPTPLGEPFNLIIAVSFGLLVPQRLLGSAKYGGLNVHPSMLPDLRGPAPLHWALLRRYSHTGITVQTLHPKQFDHGKIVAQTPSPGVAIPEGSRPSDLIDLLAPIGGRMLVDVLRNRKFLDPPIQQSSSAFILHAPKIHPDDRCIDGSEWNAEEILLRDHVLGDLWFTLRNVDGPGAEALEGKRLKVHEWRNPGNLNDEVQTVMGKSNDKLILNTHGLHLITNPGTLHNRSILTIKRGTIEGGRKDQAVAEIQRAMSGQSDGLRSHHVRHSVIADVGAPREL